MYGPSLSDNGTIAGCCSAVCPGEESKAVRLSLKHAGRLRIGVAGTRIDLQQQWEGSGKSHRESGYAMHLVC
jgi:hypothetical protein